MRSPILLLTLFIAPLLTAADPREAEIRDFMEAYGRCWDAHAKDTSCMDKLLAPDFNNVNFGGSVVDRAGFIKHVQDLPDSNTWGHPGERMPAGVVRFYGQAALVTLGVHVRTPVEQDEQFTLVIVNVDGKGWRMVRLHGSRRPSVANPKKN
jgi:hypothetical protein